jgi:hypothetical protein
MLTFYGFVMSGFIERVNNKLGLAVENTAFSTKLVGIVNFFHHVLSGRAISNTLWENILTSVFIPTVT